MSGHKRSAISEVTDGCYKCSRIENLHPQFSEVLGSNLAEDECGKLLEVLSTSTSDETTNILQSIHHHIPDPPEDFDKQPTGMFIGQFGDGLVSLKTTFCIFSEFCLTMYTLNAANRSVFKSAVH